MSFAAFVHQTVRLFLGKMSRPWLGMAVLLTACFVVPAMAQPVKGALYKDFCPWGQVPVWLCLKARGRRLKSVP